MNLAVSTILDESEKKVLDNAHALLSCEELWINLIVLLNKLNMSDLLSMDSSDITVNNIDLYLMQDWEIQYLFDVWLENHSWSLIILALCLKFLLLAECFADHFWKTFSHFLLCCWTHFLLTLILQSDPNCRVVSESNSQAQKISLMTLRRKWTTSLQ